MHKKEFQRIYINGNIVIFAGIGSESVTMSKKILVI